MSYTRPSSSAYTSNSTSQHPIVPKCSGHNRRCSTFTASASSKNPGRKFYTCPLSRDDPNRCKYFKWADQSLDPATSDSFGGHVLNPNPSTPSASRTAKAPITPQTKPRSPSLLDSIDWDNVDTETLEREAIANSPPTQPDHQPLGIQSPAKKIRLDLDQSPKRVPVEGINNPFLSPSHPQSPSHPALSPNLNALDQLSEHLHRQDRLIRASELAKEGFRKTIKRQQERIVELEDKIKALEGK